MRIRTIKPEFWTNEKLCALPEGVHMFAAALLNYADDEGHFNAHPGLITGALYALRPPSIPIPKMLEQLAGIGYVELGAGDDGRRYGRIVHFLEHQVVNKPKPSKIRPLWSAPTPGPEASGTRTGRIREEYREEQGTGNREVEQGNYDLRAREKRRFPTETGALRTGVPGKPVKGSRSSAPPQGKRLVGEKLDTDCEAATGPPAPERWSGEFELDPCPRCSDQVPWMRGTGGAYATMPHGRRGGAACVGAVREAPS